MSVNRVVLLTKGQGEPLDIYELGTFPMPKASPGNVVVRVQLRPVNHSDFLVARKGMWTHLDLKGVCPGGEGVGVIHEVGEGVTKWKVGEKVVPLIFNRYYPTGYGLWRDYVEVPEIDVVRVPDGVSDKVASQFFVNPSTAYFLVKELAVPKGEYLVQTAAASVVGRAVIALSKCHDFKTINIVRSAESFQSLKDEGADFVINSTTEDWKSRVMEITGGKGAYTAADAVGGDTARVIASCVRDGGTVISYGGLSAAHVTIDMIDLHRKVKLVAFMIDDFSDDLPKRIEAIDALWQLILRKVVNLPSSGVIYPLENFKDALKVAIHESRGGNKVFLSSY